MDIDQTTFQLSAQLLGENREAQGIAAIDNETLATCTLDGNVLIWRYVQGQWDISKLLQKHTGRVRTVVWVKPQVLPEFPTGLLLSSGFDKLILGKFLSNVRTLHPLFSEKTLPLFCFSFFCAFFLVFSFFLFFFL